MWGGKDADHHSHAFFYKVPPETISVFWGWEGKRGLDFTNGF